MTTPGPDLQAIILAAGVGRRMRPLSDRSHRALLPVGNTTILGRIMDALGQVGVRRAPGLVGRDAGGRVRHAAGRRGLGHSPRLHDEHAELLHAISDRGTAEPPPRTMRNNERSPPCARTCCSRPFQIMGTAPRHGWRSAGSDTSVLSHMTA
jgi:hypothetical protein